MFRFSKQSQGAMVVADRRDMDRNGTPKYTDRKPEQGFTH